MAIPPIGKSPAAALRAGRGGLGGGRFAPAWGAEVVSSNIVGYHKLDLTANDFFIGGSQFTTVGEADTIGVQDLMSSGLAEGDSIQFFQGSSYHTFTYYDVNFDEDWNEIGAGFTDEETGTIGTKEVSLGEAFWIKTGANTTVVFNGEVKTNATVTVSCGGGFALTAVPCPASVSLQDVKFDGIAEGDSIQFREGNGYHTFTYYDVNFDEDWNEVGPGWTDEETGVLANLQLDLNKGFWLKAAADTVTISVK